MEKKLIKKTMNFKLMQNTLYGYLQIYFLDNYVGVDAAGRNELKAVIDEIRKELDVIEKAGVKAFIKWKEDAADKAMK